MLKQKLCAATRKNVQNFIKIYYLDSIYTGTVIK